MKLYKVTLRGLRQSLGGNGCHGVFYAIASNAEQAYAIGKKTLERNDIGFSSDRELLCVELLAEEGAYPDCGTTLYRSDK